MALTKPSYGAGTAAEPMAMLFSGTTKGKKRQIGEVARSFALTAKRNLPSVLAPRKVAADSG